MEKKHRYTYGAGQQAADRLERIAGFFNPLAEVFIRKFLDNFHASTALDLGCGPGFTTGMLARTTGAGRVFGIDSSEEMLVIAASRFPEYSFIKHNVTRIPFPIKADFIYSRFLLSHLPDPVDKINLWISQLLPGGMLFIDELEDIYTDIDVFRTYLSTNTGLVASQGAVLYVGKTIAPGKYDGTVICNESSYLPVENRRAAEWFYPNTVTIWENEPYVLETLRAEERKAVSEQIGIIASGKNDASSITWNMRRIVIQRDST